MLSSWIENQKSCLKLELNEEISQLKDKISQLSARECEKQGLSLLHLNILNIKNSLFGRFSISLESNRIKNKIIDRVCFKVGDEVVLYSTRKVSKQNNDNTLNDDEDLSSSINGIVSKVSNETLEIVTDQSPEEVFLGPPLRIDLRSNEYTHNKMVGVLNQLEEVSQNQRNNNCPLIPLLFDEVEMTPYNLRSKSNHTMIPNSNSDLILMNPRLNVSQIEAIKGSLDANYISLIHGPPGTVYSTFLHHLYLYLKLTDWPIKSHKYNSTFLPHKSKSNTIIYYCTYESRTLHSFC